MVKLPIRQRKANLMLFNNDDHDSGDDLVLPGNMGKMLDEVFGTGGPSFHDTTPANTSGNVTTCCKLHVLMWLRSYLKNDRAPLTDRQRSDLATTMEAWVAELAAAQLAEAAEGTEGVAAPGMLAITEETSLEEARKLMDLAEVPDEVRFLIEAIVTRPKDSSLNEALVAAKKEQEGQHDFVKTTQTPGADEGIVKFVQNGVSLVREGEEAYRLDPIEALDVVLAILHRVQRDPSMATAFASYAMLTGMERNFDLRFVEAFADFMTGWGRAKLMGALKQAAEGAAATEADEPGDA
jgi:hypothetical protein